MVQGNVQCNPEKETAVVNGNTTIKVFDRVMVNIVAQMVEFRRSVSLVYAPK